MIPLTRRTIRHLPQLAIPATWLLLAFPLVPVTAHAAAQPLDATDMRQPMTVGAGGSIHEGDDPTYARPEFDDSQWVPVDGTRSMREYFPHSRPEVFWQRIHIAVDPEDEGLALEAFSISRAFDVYVNGEKVLQSGQVAPFVPYTSTARLLIPIPPGAMKTGMLVIALRIHLSMVGWQSPYAAFYPARLTLGQQTVLRDQIWLQMIGAGALDWIDLLFGIALSVVAFALFLAQRRRLEYLWVALLGLTSLLQVPFLLAATVRNVPAKWAFGYELLEIAGSLFIFLMVFGFLHVRIGWWTRGYVTLAVVLNSLGQIGYLRGTLPGAFQVLANIPYQTVFVVLIPIVLIVHLRRGNREAGILLIPMIFWSFSAYSEYVFYFLSQIPGLRQTALRLQGEINFYHAGPFSVTLGSLTTLLCWMSLVVILVMRSSRMSRQQAVLEGELEAAREVQQIILPERAMAIRGFSVESAYHPAQQVGGDFFQILPASDEGLLVVVGDVAGKGLPAAMLVSVLVGAVRGVAEYTEDPAALLANLNDRLAGRSQGALSTALVAHIAASGRVTVANAGHLSPYLDGEELELPGALPLGVLAGATYETTEFWLEPGSRLTFYSDGVVEAQNRDGELFGFERGRAISTQTAAEIVEAARRFGQQDDITVVAIERHAAIAHAA